MFVTRRRPYRAPSPPWHGALFTGALFADAIWLLGYTLLEVPPLEALGAWNYGGALALFLAAGIPTATWRGCPYVRPSRTSGQPERPPQPPHPGRPPQPARRPRRGNQDPAPGP